MNNTQRNLNMVEKLIKERDEYKKDAEDSREKNDALMQQLVVMENKMVDMEAELKHLYAAMETTKKENEQLKKLDV